jgi:hypothetical protein
MLWPGLDRRKLRRAGDDPRKIARLIEPRTSMTVEDILATLLRRTTEVDAARV